MPIMRSSDNGAAPASWAINGRFLTQRMTGVQRYAFEIVAAIDDILVRDEALGAALAMQLILPPGVAATPARAVIGSRQTRIGSGHAWDQFILPFYAGSGVLSLGNLGPVLARNHIVCIHDANTFIQPESYSRVFGATYRNLLPLIGRRARRVATVSRFSADALAQHRVCQPEKIFIAPNGHEHALRWDPKRARLALVDEIKRPYVLLLGSSARHKNVEIILNQAQGLDAAGIDVVVAGGASNIFATNAAIRRPNIHHTGFIDDDDLAALYERALCLVFPSRTEGFGIPPLEAMTRGCPVISSNAASLCEVGGEAVVYVDPDDGDGWREAIIALSQDGDRRATMIAKGRQRAGMFSWRQSAALYIDEILRLR
jgi:glycosyltransferase involved in cell wall biosynthesis